MVLLQWWPVICVITPYSMLSMFQHLRRNVTHETAICHSTYNSSNRDFNITRKLGYKHTFCQNFVSTKNGFFLYFHKNITCLCISLLSICQVFSVPCTTVYQWVTTNCCFMSNVLPPSLWWISFRWKVKSLRGGNEMIVWEGYKDFGLAELRNGKRKYGEILFIFFQKNSTN